MKHATLTIALVFALALGGLSCNNTAAPDEDELSVLITVNVTKHGSGSGNVTSSDIVRNDGSVDNLSCGPACTIAFDDIGAALN